MFWTKLIIVRSMSLREKIDKKLDQYRWYDVLFAWFVTIWVLGIASMISGYGLLPLAGWPLMTYIYGYSFTASFIGIPVYIIYKFKNRKN